MNPDRLLRVEMHQFRGVAGSLELDLDAEAIIIIGTNGTGKTTLADAIAWCLTGDLPALKRRQAGEPLKDDYIVSAYRPKQKATVTLELSLSGQRIKLRRTGNASASDIEIDGDTSTSMPLLDAVRDDRGLVERWLTGTGLLQQGVVEQFLTAKPDERHRDLRGLLGLTVLDDFEEAVNSIHSTRVKQATAEEVKAAQIRRQIEEREQRLTALREMSVIDPSKAASTRLYQIFTAALNIDIDHIADVTPDDVESIGKEVGSLLTATEQMRSAIPVAVRDRTQVATSVQAAETALREARSDLERLVNSEPWQQLASTALHLLGDQTCPVCTQEIDVDMVRVRLQGIVERSAATADIDAAKRRVDLANAEVGRTAAMLEHADRDQTVQEAAQLGWRQALDEVKHVRINGEVGPADIASLLKTLTELRDGLRQLWLDVRSPAARPEFERLSTEVDNLRSALGQAEVALAKVNKQVEDAKRLKEATTASCLNITTTAMDELSPALRAVHNRLAPHPTFREFDFVHKFAYRKGRTSARVEDTSTKTAANPSIVFSDGQLNTLAVAIFSAVALAVPNPPIPFLMLDDPLQALDAPNVLALADLCRDLRDHRQLIVTTHDRRFAAVLERKLAPREEGRTTRVLHFTGWRPDGPAVEAQMLPLDVPAPVLDVA